MEKNKRKLVIIILIILAVIAAMIVAFTGKPDRTGNSTQKTMPAAGGQTEIVNEERDLEAVNKDSKEAQEYESAVQIGDRESVKTVKKNNSSTSATTNKETSKNQNSNSNKPTTSTSKGETTKPTSSTTKPTTKPTTPQHTHSWTAVYKEVDKGYYETITKKVAYTKCHMCGADITNNKLAHIEAHADNGEVGSWGTAYRYYDEKVWVPNIVKVVDYHKCSCGATK